MVKRATVLLLAALALALTPALALAGRGDLAATHALAHATDRLVRGARPDISRGLLAVKRYSAQLAAQCPGVAAGSPQNHDSDELDDEVIGAMTATGYRAAAAPIAAFARVVGRLHWSNPRLTRAVATFAKKLRGLSTLATPNVCGDIASWVASGYATLPASTTQFNQRYLAVDTEAEEVPLILRLLEPYASPEDVPILHRVERFEAQLGQAEADAVAYYSRAMDAMNLNQ